MSVRIGISGWRYAPWRGVFYPKGLRQADELRYAAERFDSIELNGSFYSLQRPEYYAAWRDATPEGFVFAVKGSRFITHMKRLRDVEGASANFWASGVLELEDKLGPLLWQFPPTLAFDERFEAFFASLPRNTRDAAALAKKHDERVRRPGFGAGKLRALRHAVEVRHESFVSEQFVALLRKWDVGLVIADTAGLFPYLEDVTSDFVYMRLHGDEEIYRSGYSAEAIAHWARLVKRFAAERDVYVYFDNDVKVHAPFDALSLAKAVASPGPAITPARARDTKAARAPRAREPRPWTKSPARSAPAAGRARGGR
jgi:uncharacterized protein YecE (DUF72 family)